jgi:hypothetical protein
MPGICGMEIAITSNWILPALRHIFFVCAAGREVSGISNTIYNVNLIADVLRKSNGDGYDTTTNSGAS